MAQKRYYSPRMKRFAQRVSELLAADEEVHPAGAATDAPQHLTIEQMDAIMRRASDQAERELGLPWELGGPRYVKKTKAVKS